MSEPTIPSASVQFDTNLTHVSAPAAGLGTDGWALNDIPTSANFNYLFAYIGLWIQWLTAKLALFPGYSADTTKTIASGVILPTKGNHNIDTEGAAASDDLTNITATNLDDGRILVLGCANPSHVVVVKHASGGAGQIHLNDGIDFSLNSLSAILTLKRIGADWYEVSRSIQAGGALVGEVKTYLGSSAPAGYLMCDGSAISRSVYASLFSVVGSQHGSGDGSTTFNLPDYRGLFLRGLASYVDATCTGLPGSNTATFAGHPYRKTGTRVRLTGGSMGGLSTGTDYYIIYVDANTLAFATSLTNAIAGTKISISANSSAVISQWRDPDATSRLAPTVGASSGQNLGSLQMDDNKTHLHVLYATQETATASTGSSSNPFNDGGTSGRTLESGGNEAHPVNSAVNYIVKY